MSVLIVYFELALLATNHGALLKAIKAYGTWARLGPSCYLIFTHHSPLDVREYLRQVLRASDKLYVGTATAPSAWLGMPDDVSEWIRSKQQ